MTFQDLFAGLFHVHFPGLSMTIYVHFPRLSSRVFMEWISNKSHMLINHLLYATVTCFR